MLGPAFLAQGFTTPGRVNATMEFTAWGIMPLGSVLGGALATPFGERTTLIVFGAVACLSVVWLVASPLRTTRAVPV